MRRWTIWLVLACVGIDALLVRWWWLDRRENHASIHLLAAAREYRVDPALVKAVAWRESRFRPDARGGAGEIGLMQIGKLAAQEWAAAEKRPHFEHHELFDPALNARAGTWYLGKLLKRYAGTNLPEAYALADYNAGRANVLRWIRGPASTNSAAFLESMDFSGTRDYITAILHQRSRYRDEPLPSLPDSPSNPNLKRSIPVPSP
ncbi:MAG: lytic transglycosylase domain-containing protein [Limisphaerales bacterium]